MRSDPRALVRRLTPTARRHLERAVTAAALAQHGALMPEHVLRAMAADESGDVALLLTRDERIEVLVDTERLLAHTTRSTPRPALSEKVHSNAWPSFNVPSTLILREVRHLG